MEIDKIKKNLKEAGIYHAEVLLDDYNAIVGYEKKFKWSWMATQLNTFIVAVDLDNQEVNVPMLESYLKRSFKYAEKHYTGWPRGLQSGLAVILVLISTNVTEEAKTYCLKLKSGKKWAGFSIPIVHDAGSSQTFKFEKKPMWGSIYYPHINRLISMLSA
ncbi:hypothetical protein [Crocinitomix algicola]|uniref:hypothetical protein n=1 Tax=Crocinitomix algicola TaxID=1740263 RepID=UPI00083687DF|nr:hypothetical protein [Crocinitomix algicola]